MTDASSSVPVAKMPPVIKLLHPAAPCSGSIALHDVHCTLIFSPLEPLQFIHMKVVPRLPATINCDRCKGLQCCKANLVMRGVVWLMLAKRCRVHAMPSYIAQRQPPSCLRMLTFSLRQEAMALNKPQPNCTAWQAGGMRDAICNVLQCIRSRVCSLARVVCLHGLCAGNIVDGWPPFVPCHPLQLPRLAYHPCSAFASELSVHGVPRWLMQLADTPPNILSPGCI